MKDNAKVIIRVRPLLKFQDEPAWITTHTSIKCMHSKSVKSKLSKSIHPINESQLQNYTYTFDRVVQPTLSSQKIYKSQIRKVVQKSLNNTINCTVVAYGQTCSGKTYTLLGIKQAPGVIPCIFRDMFNSSHLKEYRYIFRISYTEIYNEKLIDLLSMQATGKELKIVKDSDWGAEIAGAARVQVSNFEECLEVLDRGQNSRKYGEKLNHDRSSRSHTILKIYIQKWDEQLVCHRSAINVVDLAGSERLTATQHSNQQTGHINKSLFQFSNVISKLSQSSSSSSTSSTPHQHIPYRDSKLTRLLQNSLTKNSNLAIIFCISPAVINFQQSVSTLRLACKAKKVQITNQISSQDINSTNIKRLQQIIRDKDQQIKKLKQKIYRLNKEVSRLEEQYIMNGNKNNINNNNKQKQKQNISNDNTNINKIQQSQSQSQNVVNIKALVILDHQNFMLSINDTVCHINQQNINQIKCQFVDKLSALYEQYAQRVVSAGLGLGYEESWLKIEDICFANMFYDKGALLEYRLPLIKQACANLGAEDSAFADVLKLYVQKMEQYVQQHMHTYNKNMHTHRSVKQQEKCTPKYCSQSPIFEQSTIEVVDGEHTLGSKLVAWGCKKDHRVFKTEGNAIIAQCSSMGNIKAVACGAHHTLALNEQGDVYGWGKNQHKQVCNSNHASIPIPRHIIMKGMKVKSIASGWAHTLLLTQQGCVYSYGYGEDGQLGHGQYKNIAEPQRVQIECVVAAIYAGHSHSGFIDVQHNYYAFGFNKDYRLMVAETKQVSKPMRVNIKGIIKAALGVTHSCLLTKQGRLYSGGVGTNGQLGVTLTPQITGYETIVVPQKNFQQNPIQKICPIVQVEFFIDRKVIDVSCGECSTAVITQSNQLYTFGKTTFDRLGHTQSKICKILDNVDRVEMGYRHGFAWNNKNKEVYGWGFNMYNQLGTLQAKDIKKPELIHTISTKDVISISTGFFHSAAVCK